MPAVHVAPLRVLLLPGRQDSGASHWQSRWETLHGHKREQQADWHWPRRGHWPAGVALLHALAGAAGP